jgi:DNA-binding XRE family transcriptional regulator
MTQIAPKTEQTNYESFMESYDSILKHCIETRKIGGFSQEFMADWLGTTRKSVVDLENKRHVKVGLLLNYADKLSINVKLNFEVL